MRAYLLLVGFLAAAATLAEANSITIGQLEFLGTNPQGTSAFKVTLDSNGITASPLMLKNLVLSESGRAQSSGSITFPAAILFVAGPGFVLPACPCKYVQIDLFLPTQGRVFTLQLANGALFTTSSTPKFFLRPLPGQKFLSAGESAPIVLTSVPEPGAMALISGGLAVLCYRRRKRRPLGTAVSFHTCSSKTVLNENP